MRSARLLALLLACGAAIPAATAATDKSGVIEDETWTQAMSPIRVVGDISVYSLTIQPGVEVTFTGNYVFDCPGVLRAQGDAANKIWFHGDTGITWKGIKFLNSAPGSVFDHCIVENSNNRGVTITNTPLNITNCAVRNNSVSGSGGGIYVSINTAGIALPLITNCDVSNNTATGWGGGVYYWVTTPGTGAAIFSGCRLSNNTAAGSGANGSNGGGGIYAGVDATASVRFLDCDFSNNVCSWGSSGGSTASRGGGSYLDGIGGRFEFLRCSFKSNSASLVRPSATGSGTAAGGGLNGSTTIGMISLRNCLFMNNTASSTGPSTYAYGGGLSLYGGNGQIFNSSLVGNNVTAGSARYGAGMGFYGGTARVENCTIASNGHTGLDTYGGTTVLNSILYFNNSNGTQIGGSPTITYSNIQNGYEGTGNINLSPLFRTDGTVPDPWPWPPPVPSSWPWPNRLSNSSPCKDAGNPDPGYNDLCFYDATTTPWGSVGTARNDMGAFGGPGACLWEPGSTALAVQAPIGGGIVGVGDTVSLTVQASGIGPFSYVWKKNGEVVADVPGHIGGATTGTLTIAGATAADAGNYTVEVTNALGDTMVSPVAPVAVDPLRVAVKMFAGVIIQAEPGTTVKVEYTNDLSSGSWTQLWQGAVPTSPYTYYDADSPDQPRRFYRAVEVSPP